VDDVAEKFLLSIRPRGRLLSFFFPSGFCLLFPTLRVFFESGGKIHKKERPGFQDADNDPSPFPCDGTTFPPDFPGYPFFDFLTLLFCVRTMEIILWLDCSGSQYTAVSFLFFFLGILYFSRFPPRHFLTYWRFFTFFSSFVPGRVLDRKIFF